MSASDHFDFWISYRGPKNKKYVFFYFSPVFIFGGWKLPSKLGLKNHFCGKNGLFENLVSQTYFAFKDTKFVHWHYSPISNSSRDIPQKWFFNPNFERTFHPPNMKTGKNKKTRISYFSVLYNISKNRNDRRRTPKILSLLVKFCKTILLRVITDVCLNIYLVTLLYSSCNVTLISKEYAEYSILDKIKGTKGIAILWIRSTWLWVYIILCLFFI